MWVRRVGALCVARGRAGAGVRMRAWARAGVYACARMGVGVGVGVGPGVFFVDFCILVNIFAVLVFSFLVFS